MSYAIIRNVKYKRENLKGIYRHNERKNYNYSNRNIDVSNGFNLSKISFPAPLSEVPAFFQVFSVLFPILPGFFASMAQFC